MTGRPPVRFDGAAVHFGARTLWRDLTFEVERAEFLAVLGPNGSGKTTLLKVLLGQQPLSAGTVEVAGSPPRRGSRHIGYIPQQRAFDPDLPVRARDLVRFGLDGHRAGLLGGRSARSKVDAALAAVGATSFADAPIGTCSGGEQQRLRVAQALLGDPDLLLCDEPLLSLDPGQTHAVTALIDSRRRQGTTVVFVTHEINPILAYVDRVLYLVGGRWSIGDPSGVLTSETLTGLYGVPVEVLRVGERIVVVGPEEGAGSGGHHHHPPAEVGG
ncbi:MAG TPA: ABC transporter ATP-binding protein [Acidimicrobiales bacterium]|nr:ABC transporter ATP-binding protein [Acidimicrobiales bacterium]